ncbi:T9SS type A sorting domain-containing protein [Rhodocytophaga rosea]|uniref:T9SS type A sorting domain-containing protein n=1 Tax=Rhodocytophaga rosea TaxID=2704465 RepID=A0A6C0GSL5_9BACT|nr:ELWxxDGT repeat protein [Rhodocytophaga rosea]QHT70450.1 T9SS type A sorting domain-containing protein [Rhodocytophaga rosea]
MKKLFTFLPNGWGKLTSHVSNYVTGTAFILSFVFCCTLVTAQPTLVKDINTDPDYIYNNSLWPENLTAINGVVYFTGSSEKTGRELWRSDGTAAGTYQVKDINPGISSSNPSYLLNVNGTLFFIANYRLYYNSDESGPNPDAGKGSGFELWKSDGTFTGTIKLGDFSLVNREYGWLDNIPVRLMNVNGTLFFTANNSFDTYTLYKSDGTPAGTQPVTQVQVSEQYYYSNAFLGSAGKYVYYNQLDPGSEDGHESLWRTDGTPAGTIRLLGPTAEESYSLLSHSFNVNGTLFFSAPGPLGQELWKSNGTPEGTLLVKDIVPGPEGSDPTPLGASANILYFSTDNALWKSDGTAQGTVLVKNGIFSSGAVAGPGGQVYFSAQDATHGYELWKSDGTTQGTMLVKDINPGVATSSISNIRYMNGMLYFIANDGVNGRALWKSDGTLAGTLMVKDINPGTDNNAIAGLTVAQNTLFFSGQTTQNKPNLWKSDGTATGTVLVKEPNETIDRTQSSAPATFTNVNGLLYFTTLQPKPDSPYDYTYNLWKSDGTGSGTILLKQGLPYAPEWPIGVDNTLFFSFSQTSELWKSDGTPAGTQLVKDINGNLTSYYGAPRYLTRFGGKLVFAADDGSHGNELWKSDGTAQGTVLVKDINPGSGAASSFVNNLVYMNSMLYFNANDGVKGQELWKSDGTAQGTLLVKDINSGSIGSDPGEFTLFNSSLFFVTKEGTQQGLWKTDGTSQGTVFIKNVNESTLYNTVPEHLTNVNGTLYFTVKSYASQGVKIWKSNGTAQGTTLVKTISMGFVPQILNTLDVNGILYFIVADEEYKYPRIMQLWKSDGTETGTIKIEDDVTQLGTANGSLYFTRNDNLWKSNGTPESAIKVADLTVAGFASIGKRLYLRADDGKTGFELWKYDSDACPTVTKLNLSVSGSTICQTQPVTITIDQSEVGILYQARLQNTLIGEPVKGTGGKITLPIPVASLSTGKNTFYISATGCTVAQLTDSVVVTLLASCPTACSATGSILQEKWLNITGSSVSAIPVNTQPSSSTQLTSFETTPNQGDNYGERIRGYLCVPTTGSYTFYIAGDDKCELYLSSDEDPAKKIKIATVPYYTGLKVWNKYPEQKSAAISLVAGKKYYIEALHKESTGNDNVAVGWQTSSTAAISVITGAYLSPYIPQVTGKISREFWAAVTGYQISNIPLTTAPTTTNELTIFETAANQGNTYGQRFRGYIHPQVSGNYRFFIAGDDKGELYLSTDEDPAKKTKVASITAPTSLRQWNKYASQQSIAISLVAGKKYYIEALHKENSGDDNISVGWSLPSQTTISVIAGTYLSPFLASPTANIARVGVEESLESNVSLYPNPFEDKLTLSTQQAGKLYISVVDNLGRTVYQTIAQGVQAKFNLAHLKQGVYVIKVSTEDGQTQVSRVIKQ